MSGGFSIHAVDLTRGETADGLFIELLNEGGKIIACGRITSNGSPDCHEVLAIPKPNGAYTARFHIGEYYRQHDANGSNASTFLDIVPYDFQSHDPGFHVHLPIKFSPWGYSCFRGN